LVEGPEKSGGGGSIPSFVATQGHNALQAMSILFEDHMAFTGRMTEPAEPT
jgi:hypothetical protein